MTDKKPNIDLNKIKKSIDYKVPENYFDQLPQFIQSKVVVQHHSMPLWRTIFTLKKVGLTLSLLTILIVVIFVLKPDQDTSNENCLSLACVSYEEMDSYYSDMNQLNEDEIINEAINNFESLQLDEFTHQTEQTLESLNLSSEENLYDIEIDDNLLDELNSEDINDLL